MSEFIAVQIIVVFAIMFIGIVVAVLWFTHANSKIESSKEIKKAQMDVIDRHFNDMVRIECPYCKTIYTMSNSVCPGCGANTRTILFPEMPK